MPISSYPAFEQVVPGFSGPEVAANAHEGFVWVNRYTLHFMDAHLRTSKHGSALWPERRRRTACGTDCSRSSDYIEKLRCSVAYARLPRTNPALKNSREGLRAALCGQSARHRTTDASADGNTRPCSTRAVTARRQSRRDADATTNGRASVRDDQGLDGCHALLM